MLGNVYVEVLKTTSPWATLLTLATIARIKSAVCRNKQNIQAIQSNRFCFKKTFKFVSEYSCVNYSTIFEQDYVKVI